MEKIKNNITEKNVEFINSIKEKIIDEEKLKDIALSVREMILDFKEYSQKNNLNTMFLMECAIVDYYDYIDVINSHDEGEFYLKRIENFPKKFLIPAMRLMKLINMSAPDIIINNEAKLLTKVMYECNIVYIGIDD